MTDTAELVVYRARGRFLSQVWRWRLVHSNGHILATSGEGYRSRTECLRQGHKIKQGEYAARTVEST